MVYNYKKYNINHKCNQHSIRERARWAVVWTSTVDLYQIQLDKKACLSKFNALLEAGHDPEILSDMHHKNPCDVYLSSHRNAAGRYVYMDASTTSSATMFATTGPTAPTPPLSSASTL